MKDKLIEPLMEQMSTILFYAKNNAYALLCIMHFALPTVCIVLGQNLGSSTSVITPVCIVLAVQMVLWYTKKVYSKMGKGEDPPIPRVRFTHIDASGEVSIESERVQELLLYMADLEDYYNRKGKLK